MYNTSTMLLNPKIRLLWTIVYFWAVRFLAGLLICTGAYYLGTGQITTLFTDQNPLRALTLALEVPLLRIPLALYVMVAWTFVSLWLSIMTIHYRQNSMLSIPAASTFAQRMALSIAFWSILRGLVSILLYNLAMPIPIPVMIILFFAFFYLPVTIEPQNRYPQHQLMAALQLLRDWLWSTCGVALLYAAAAAGIVIPWLAYQNIYALLAAHATFQLLEVGTDLFRAFVAQRTSTAAQL